MRKVEQNAAWQAGFLAGAAAEREAIIELLYEIRKAKTIYGRTWSNIERRIRQRGEAEEPRKEK